MVTQLGRTLKLKEMLTDNHTDEENKHQLEVAGVETVVAGGSCLVHHPEVCSQEQVPRRRRQIESNCMKGKRNGNCLCDLGCNYCPMIVFVMKGIEGSFKAQSTKFKESSRFSEITHKTILVNNCCRTFMS